MKPLVLHFAVHDPSAKAINCSINPVQTLLVLVEFSIDLVKFSQILSEFGVFGLEVTDCILQPLVF